MMAAHPLTGIHVLVTRPRQQADALCALIEAAGGRALRWPLLDIVSIDNPQPAIELLSRQQAWDWLIFVSSNAVHFALMLNHRLHDLTVDSRVAAVGKATANALIQAGIRVDLIPEPQFNSESLLASSALAEIRNQRILIVRGQGGREILAQELRNRGAQVAYAEVYRRIVPDIETEEWIRQWRLGNIHVVTITSGEALDHLMRLLGESAAEFAPYTPLVVIGSRIERLARERGWYQVISAANASDQAIVEGVIQLLSTSGSFSPGMRASSIRSSRIGSGVIEERMGGEREP
jgi:uroporphyrinogen-III synthase